MLAVLAARLNTNQLSSSRSHENQSNNKIDMTVHHCQDHQNSVIDVDVIILQLSSFYFTMNFITIINKTAVFTFSGGSNLLLL